MAKKFKFLRSKGDLLVGAAMIVAAAGGVYLLHQHNRSKSVIITPPGVNLAPATEQEKQESADSKDKLDQPVTQPTTTTTTNNKRQITVVITYAKADSIRAYVTGIFEDGGLCTATFTQGATTVTRTSLGFENVSYTQCAPITPDLPNFGTWSVVVSYNSGNATGTSQQQTL